jgi:hypothetical protein
MKALKFKEKRLSHHPQKNGASGKKCRLNGPFQTNR